MQLTVPKQTHCKPPGLSEMAMAGPELLRVAIWLGYGGLEAAFVQLTIFKGMFIWHHLTPLLPISALAECPIVLSEQPSTPLNSGLVPK